MALEDFKSDSSSEDEDDTWVSDGGVDWTACSCDISEVQRIDEPVDELDLIAHLRAEHGLEFEEAKGKVTSKKGMMDKMTEDSNLPEHDKKRMSESEDAVDFMAKTFLSSVGKDESMWEEAKSSKDNKETDMSEWDDAYN